ncbi:hypothetical protein NR798_23495 [Archangium gephyra]|uniref:hypothetical protein n=1 Tax=Archangium gephyra TaxID=48 RepID=UPI0035D456AB
MSKLPSLLLLLLCACETPMTQPEPFQILDITPSVQVANDAKSVTVRLDVEPRFHVDYGDQEVRILEEPVLEIGSETLVPMATYLGHGRFQGQVAPGLPPGRYPIRVKLGDGREATLADAYEIKPAVGFWVEQIGDQKTGEPFTVVLHAGDPYGEFFEGTVQVSVYIGNTNANLFSFVSGPFTAGVRAQELTVDTPGNNYLIVVQDVLGNTATSNAFRVFPKN